MTQNLSDTVDRFLDAVTAGQGIPEDLFTEHAVLDATIPDFRFGQHGAERVAGQLSSWFEYDAPGAFEHLDRTPLPGGGELVRFVLMWVENGEKMAAHQVHVVELEDDRIASLQVWCGGRWNTDRQTEIAAAM